MSLPYPLGSRCFDLDPLEPLHRPDLTAPWEAPDPIPEIFRADFYRDKDPGLTL
ncbi:MAG: hypothetical protein ACF8QF_11960 [Phycisphaerales bacterium]